MPPPPAPASHARRAARPDRRRERSRAALLEAAIELFQEHGIRGTKVEDVCERADVALRTFFNHFETREHLYQALGLERARQLAAALDALSGAPEPFDRRLRGFLRGIGAYLQARPLYRELVAEMLNRRHDGGSEATRSGVLGAAARRFVAAGVARGEVTRRHAPEVLADILVGSLTAALTNWTGGEDFDLAPELAATAEALLDLMRPAPGEGG